MPAVATRQPVKAERVIPGLHSVQGINSKVDDIRLRGDRLVAIIGDAIVEAVLRRKIAGASSLELTVLDPSPGRRLLRGPLLKEAHELRLDGLQWKLVKVSNEGKNAPLKLTYEPLIVYLLKRIKGPHKAFRDKVTRAEFIKARVFEARPRPKFVSPELHVVQDIDNTQAGKEAKKRSEESRGKGIGQNPHLEINGRPATKEQVNIIERMLRVAESEGAVTKVMEALVLAVIDESVAGALSDNLLQIEPQSVSGFSGDPTNPEQSAKGFLRGYESSAPGALGVYKANPGFSPAQIATTVQRNAAGAGPYERFTEEGRAWAAAYGGGADIGTLHVERYAFQQPKKESNWKCGNRLAGDVNWRFFESAGWVYLLDEPTLLRSHTRMRVSDVAPGIIDTKFDYDIGKPVNEFSVEALAKTWAAPPGSVAQVSRHGPADGAYLVEEIESKPSGRKGLVNVTLKKPTEELPEPEPKRERSTVSFGSGIGGSAPPKLAAIIEFIDRVDAASTTYLWGGGHGSFASASQRMDCSGFVSAAVHVAGYLNSPITSGQFANVFPAGEGEWVAIYGDSQHVLMKVKYPDGNWRWAGTSSTNPGGGPGWLPDDVGESSAREHGNVSHPPGL